GQVLRRRHHAQAQAARKAERRQEAHEAGRQRGDSAGSLSRHTPGRRQITAAVWRRRQGRASARHLNYGRLPMMFALFMLVVLALTGFIWLLDSLYLRKRRPEGSDEPVLVEYSKSFFPVIL